MPNKGVDNNTEQVHPVQLNMSQPGIGKSPWGNVQTFAPCSLNDVMSEELAIQLEHDDSATLPHDENVDLSQFMTSDDLDTSNDLLLAQMIQHEYDREHDKEIKIKENKFNSQSKVKVSYQNYRAVHPSQWDEDDTDEEVEETVEVQEPPRNFRGRGISGRGKNIVTKHDPTICGRRNAHRVMEQFPPEIKTGDGIGMDMKLPNHVYNKLKTHSKAENKRSHRLHEKKEHSTAEHAMDPKTRLILYKLVNSGTLEDVNGIISAGKESVVFHGNTGLDAPEIDGFHKVLPPEVAIKVFKTTLNEFKNRSDYVKGDVRFFKDEFKKQNPRKILRLWADKEVFNLRRMEKYGVPCPTVVLLKKHVLLMSFIGKNQVAAPKIKDAHLEIAEAEMAYEQCVKNMKKMYRECQMVHADLSEYNMLWHEDTLYFIDVGQAVDRMHPHAHEFLLRDCKNVTAFFKKLGVPDVPDEYKLFNEITGLGLQGEGHHFLMQVEEYEKNEEKLRTGNSSKNYPFDFFFARATEQRKTATSQSTDKKTDVPEHLDVLASQVAPDLEDRLGEGSMDDADWSTTDDSEDDFEMVDKIPELGVDSFEFVRKDGEVAEGEEERGREEEDQVALATTTCTNHDKRS